MVSASANETPSMCPSAPKAIAQSHLNSNFVITQPPMATHHPTLQGQPGTSPLLKCPSPWESALPSTVGSQAGSAPSVPPCPYTGYLPPPPILHTCPLWLPTSLLHPCSHQLGSGSGRVCLDGTGSSLDYLQPNPGPLICQCDPLKRQPRLVTALPHAAFWKGPRVPVGLFWPHLALRLRDPQPFPL